MPAQNVELNLTVPDKTNWIRQNFGDLWPRDENFTYLNNGSFGHCSYHVLAAQNKLREQMVRRPRDFLVIDNERLRDVSRSKLADFVGTRPENIALITNATTGINAVLRSLKFNASDEIVLTSHEYNAVRNVVNEVSSTTGAQVKVVPLPFPIEGPDQVVELVSKALSKNTKLLVLDHITSQTGLVMPVAQLISKAKEMGINTLIDGAHAPGMIPLSIDALSPTYYVGNCHKWLGAPLGSAFLFVDSQHQHLIRPPVISHGANSTRNDRSRFWLEFDWMGTCDPTAQLCIPEALDFINGLMPGGAEMLMKRNRELALEARKLLCETLKVAPPGPDSMIGSLVALKISDGDPIPLENSLRNEFKIEVLSYTFPEAPSRILRVSAHTSNCLHDFEKLDAALREIQRKGEAI